MDMLATNNMNMAANESVVLDHRIRYHAVCADVNIATDFAVRRRENRAKGNRALAGAAAQRERIVAQSEIVSRNPRKERDEVRATLKCWLIADHDCGYSI